MKRDGDQQSEDRQQRAAPRQVRDRQGAAGRLQRVEDRKKLEDSSVGAAFQPRHHYFSYLNDFNRFNDLTNNALRSALSVKC